MVSCGINCGHPYSPSHLGTKQSPAWSICLRVREGTDGWLTNHRPGPGGSVAGYSLVRFKGAGGPPSPGLCFYSLL